MSASKLAWTLISAVVARLNPRGEFVEGGMLHSGWMITLPKIAVEPGFLVCETTVRPPARVLRGFLGEVEKPVLKRREDVEARPERYCLIAKPASRGIF